ncbi:hypothetical protein TYRP_009905 [Tyrophagus putrescentiae]|nr:hypothetical protein TYRP_009905 [Tyrophagus putrescentiae]
MSSTSPPLMMRVTLFSEEVSKMMASERASSIFFLGLFGELLVEGNEVLLRLPAVPGAGQSHVVHLVAHLIGHLVPIKLKHFQAVQVAILAGQTHSKQSASVEDAQRDEDRLRQQQLALAADAVGVAALSGDDEVEARLATGAQQVLLQKVARLARPVDIGVALKVPGGDRAGQQGVAGAAGGGHNEPMLVVVPFPRAAAVSGQRHNDVLPIARPVVHRKEEALVGGLAHRTAGEADVRAPVVFASLVSVGVVLDDHRPGDVDHFIGVFLFLFLFIFVLVTTSTTIATINIVIRVPVFITV